MKNTSEAPEADNKDSGILSSPLSFIRNGYIYWYGVGLRSRGGSGNYWSLRSASTTNSNVLSFDNAGLNPQLGSSRGYGFAVRCVGTSKSFTTLINTSYSMKNEGQTEEDNRDSGLLSGPLSFLRSGYFYWYGAGLGGRNNNGEFWSLRSSSTIYSNALYFGNTRMNSQVNDDRGYGVAVRCELHSLFSNS